MEQKRISYFILGVLAVVLSLQQAWVSGFFADGYLYAVFGKNAAIKGHWLIPHLNESVYPEFHHHTPFLFILEGLFFKAFGATFLSARIFSSLFYLGTGALIINYLRKKTKISPYFPVLMFLTIPPLFKKVRFPNLDIALMLVFFGAFLFYRMTQRTQKPVHSYLTGLMFGLSLLIKGPVALLIPLCITIDLIAQKKLIYLKSVHAWLGLLLGFALFSLWPLALSINGRMDIFHQWVDFTFIHTIRDGRGAGEPFYTYLLFLLKNAPIWFILALMSLRVVKKSEFMTSAWVFFITILMFFSIPKFKYSNYLIPMYPFMGMVAGHFIFETLNESIRLIIKRVLSFLIPIGALLLLIFPLTTKIRRDREIFEIKKSFSQKGLKPEKWTIVASGYPFYALASLNEWTDGSLTYQRAQPDVANCDSCVFLVKNESLSKFKELNPSFKSYALLKRYGTTLMVPESFKNKNLKL